MTDTCVCYAHTRISHENLPARQPDLIVSVIRPNPKFRFSNMAWGKTGQNWITN